MLIIRQQHMDALSHYPLQQFENRMVAHIRQKFHQQSKHLLEEDLRLMVRSGIGRARIYDVTDEYDARRYMEYMVMLSPEFDTNPETEWAGSILRDKRLDGTTKMRRIDETYLFSMRK